MVTKWNLQLNYSREIVGKFGEGATAAAATPPLRDYITLSTVMVSPSTLPMMVTFSPAWETILS